MRPAQSLLQLAACLSPLIALVSASAKPDAIPDVPALAPRAEKTPSSPSASASEGASGATAAPKSDATVASKTKTDGSQTDVDLNTATAKPSDPKKSDSTPSKSDIPPDAPPGGVNMVTPAPNLEATPLFKIKDFVTLGWNYTSLVRPPRAIDVLISCSIASDSWTLTENMTYTSSVAFVWDTKKQANSVEKPLLTGVCNLIVKDSNVSSSTRPEPGLLNVWSGFVFGLYAAQPYTPFPDWTCLGCSDASSLINHQALGFAVTMSVITFLSFTWFVAGLGLH